MRNETELHCPAWVGMRVRDPFAYFLIDFFSECQRMATSSSSHFTEGENKEIQETYLSLLNWALGQEAQVQALVFAMGDVSSIIFSDIGLFSPVFEQEPGNLTRNPRRTEKRSPGCLPQTSSREVASAL